jgi:hypothetical protein
MTADFILGPQIPMTNSWLDQTLITKAKEHGELFPASPPTDGNALNAFTLHHYYDLVLSEYIAYKRTGDSYFLTLARKCADSWWQMTNWIEEGRTRWEGLPAPRHSGVMGLMLRALDGRPEMWDWIIHYVRVQVNAYILTHINDADFWYGVRESAFMLHFAALLAKVCPDSYPLQAGGTATDGAQVRAEMVAHVENVCLNYFGRRQRADGSWRWGSYEGDYGDTKFNLAEPAMAGATAFVTVDPAPETIPKGEMPWIGEAIFRVTEQVPAGSKRIPVEQKVWDQATQTHKWLPLQQGFAQNTEGQYAVMVNTMQPFMVGLLLCALCDAHELVVTPAAKESIKKQILTGCRFLYAGGPYTRQYVERFKVNLRGFHYFAVGGTSVNPTKYENGVPIEQYIEPWHVSSTRQTIGMILPAFGYAYRLSGDPFYKDAVNEMYDSAYSGRDGFRSFVDDTPKNYNQHARRIGSLLAWMGNDLAIQPSTEPVPTTTATPSSTTTTTTTATPSPDGTKATSIVDSTGAAWTLGPNKETLRNGTHVGAGAASIYKYASRDVYALGTDSRWYKWSGSTWVDSGTQEPGGVTQTTSTTTAPTTTTQPTTTSPTTSSTTTTSATDEYKVEPFDGTEKGRTALYQRMRPLGYGAWSETDPEAKGHKIKFRRFP